MIQFQIPPKIDLAMYDHLHDDPGGTGSRGTAPRGTRHVVTTARPHNDDERAPNGTHRHRDDDNN